MVEACMAVLKASVRVIAAKLRDQAAAPTDQQPLPYETLAQASKVFTRGAGPCSAALSSSSLAACAACDDTLVSVVCDAWQRAVVWAGVLRTQSVGDRWCEMCGLNGARLT
eukprot:1782549-Rhodomonas_salina.1